MLAARLLFARISPARFSLVSRPPAHPARPIRTLSRSFSARASAAEAPAMAPQPGRVAVAQMTSSSDTAQNFETCRSLAQQAQAQGVQLLSLPECFSFIGTKGEDSIAIAQPLSGPIMQQYCSLARETGVWLSLGGFQEQGEAGPGSRIFNTNVLLNDQGSIVAAYRKIHLFDVDVPNGPILMESRSTAPGGALCCADSPVGRLGITTCYDLRFPELYQRLRFDMGAQILLVPSAFTVKTGGAHWEIMLRARAIESQCYVMAAAQAGQHNEKRESYGDALIVDPWGTVVARCPDRLGTGIAVADVDLSFLDSIRQRMPLQDHRRLEVYSGNSGAQAPRKGNASSL